MPKPLGSTKTGGRKKGTPNKRTGELAEIFDKAGLSVPERIISLLPELEAGKQVDVLLNLMGYLFPKKKTVDQAIEIEMTQHEPPKEINLEDLEKEIAAAQVVMMESFGRDYPLANDEVKKSAKKVVEYFAKVAAGNLEEDQVTSLGI